MSYALEEKMFHCWHITNDIRTIVDKIDRDQISLEELGNVLAGVAQLADMKFNDMFDEFEKYVREKNGK